MNLTDTLIGALVGGLVALIVNIFFWRWQAEKEAKCLIVAFGEELALAFERCVLYAQQQESGEVSYSGLFNFTDASTLSRLSAITDDPEVIQAIVSLKSTYYQVGRHVEDASRLIGQAARVPYDKVKRGELELAASHARDTALAFFDYEREKNLTTVIVEHLKKLSPGKVADRLEATFSDATRKYERMKQQPRGHSAGSGL